MIKNMEKVFLYGKMAESTLEHGIKVNNRE
jgi:hypothetical protein